MVEKIDTHFDVAFLRVSFDRPGSRWKDVMRLKVTNHHLFPEGIFQDSKDEPMQ